MVWASTKYRAAPPTFKVVSGASGTFSWISKFVLNPRRISSRESVSRKRQLSHSLACSGKDGVAERGNIRRHARLTDSRWWSGAFYDVDVGLTGRIVHTSDLIIIKVRLIHNTVGGGDLSRARDAGAERGSAFKLLAHHFRVHDDSGIERGVDLRDAYGAFVIDFYFYDSCHIGEEAAMNGYAHAVSLA